MTSKEHKLLTSDLAESFDDRLDDEVFVARVMDACSSSTVDVGAAGGARPPARRAARLGFALGASLLAAAAAVLLLGPASEPERSAGHWTARGPGSAETRAVIVQAFVGRAAADRGPPLLEGAIIGPGDGILIRYSNATAHERFLMVFALDEARQVHWLHPAYLREGETPTSLSLPAHAEDRLLDEIAEPEQPAPGALGVYALVTERALNVAQVESRLARAARPSGASAAVYELFPEAEVEEWRCTWRAR
jgi:hypothetical protein